MDIHHFQINDKVYLGTTVAKESPEEEGVYLIPANCTTVQPPSLSANQAAVFNDTSWDVVPDFRGTVYWTDINVSVMITEVNEIVPVDATTTVPDINSDTLDNGTWRSFTTQELTDTLDAEKTAQSDLNKINPLMKALLLSINDGSFVPGGDLTLPQLRAFLKSKL